MTEVREAEAAFNRLEWQRNGAAGFVIARAVLYYGNTDFIGLQ